MAMNGGKSDATTPDSAEGLQKEIYVSMNENGLLPPQTTGESTKDYNLRVQKTLKAFYAIGYAIVKHIKDEMEIKNISVTTGVLLPLIPTVTPQDGGSTLFSATLKPSIDSKTLSQNNSGKGLVE